MQTKGKAGIGVGELAAGTLAVLLTAFSLVALVWDPFSVASAAGRPAAGATIEVLSDDGSTRVVRHIGGVTSVPAHPRRICALSFADELLELGVKPVAVPCDWRGRVVDYLAEPLRGAALIPQGYASWLPNFEAVAGARPDLILISPNDRHDYQQLGAIAPAVVIRDASTANHENRSIDALKRRLRDVGAVVGRGAEAERAIAAFDRHAAVAREAIRDTMRGKTIAFLRTRDREWRLYGRRGDNGAEAVYDVLALNAPAMVSASGMAALDPESLVGFDTDYLIVVSDDTPGARQTLNRLRQHPLWQRVTAIRRNQVLEITTYRHWIAGGLLGKSRMIDEFVACIRGGGGHDTR